MEPEQLRTAVKQLRMPDAIRARILQCCQAQALQSAPRRRAKPKGDIAMQSKQYRFARKRAAAVLAAAALCLGCAGGAVAAARAGHFKNVTTWLGTVTGTRYEQASTELEASAAYAGGTLTVTADFLLPQAFPYRALETLSIGSYQITDSAGQVAAEGGPTGEAAVSAGRAVITLACPDLAAGGYTLCITAFTGGSKGDAPLPIEGRWECPFLV